jgi:outer membrane protein assembly factor BamB
MTYREQQLARTTWLLPLLCLVAASTPPRIAAEPASSVRLPGENSAIARRLAAAEKLAAQAQWAEALDEYQRIIDEGGDALVPVEHGPSVQARRLCHQHLAALPADALRLYRQRVDARARKWLEQGRGTRDAEPLRRVVAEAFCSRAGEQALDLLGNLAFGRGDFAEAEAWWRMIALPVELDRGKARVRRPQSGEVVFPDPEVDLAQVRAKELLARLFQGQRQGFGEALEAYRVLHGQSAGDFAGRRGRYADTLQILAARADELTAPPGGESWPTFAGDVARNAVRARLPARLSWSLTPDPSWSAPLSEVAQGPVELRDEPVGPVQFAFYPVIAGNHVLVADARLVTSYDLRTGEVMGSFDAGEDLPGDWGDVDLSVAAEPDGRYTLTVEGERAYVRLGAQTVRETGAQGRRRSAKQGTLLVCLDLPAGGSGKLMPHWKEPLRPAGKEGETAVFEGTPLVHDERLYVARTRFGTAGMTVSVDCFDADTGSPRWSRDVLHSVVAVQPGHVWHARHLLTLAGRYVIYGSYGGAVVALDAVTGQRAWAARYDTDDTPVDQAGGPCPCLYADGRVYVAPADGDRILCLNVATGQTLWQGEPEAGATQLLGVAGGRLVYIAADHIASVDAATGQAAGGWVKADLHPRGRGFLAGDLVFVPTRDGLRVFRQDSGDLADDWYAFLANGEGAAGATQGNVAFGDGCLVVAGTRQLSAFVPESLQLEKRRRAAEADPQSAAAHYRLALAQIGVGLDEAAVQELKRAEALAVPGEQWHNRPLAEVARTQGQHFLMVRAREAEARHNWAAAAQVLERAAVPEFAASERLRALRLRAELWERAGQPGRAATAWQAMLAEPGLRTVRVMTADGLPQPAGLLAARQLAALRRAHGSGLDEYEATARARLAAARGSGAMARVLQEFPATKAARAVWDAIEARSGQSAASQVTQVCHELLPVARDDEERARLLAALARAHERQRCWPAAWAVWQRLARAHGTRTLAAIDPDRPVVEFVRRELDRSEFRPSASVGAGPRRAWEVQLADGERLLAPEDAVSAGDRPALLCCVQDRQLICRDAATGRRVWARLLPEAPSWVGYHVDMVLAAGTHGVYSLCLADGNACWSFVPNEPSAALAGWQLTASTLFVVQDGRRLLAIDADSGWIAWAAWPPGAWRGPVKAGPSYQLNYLPEDQRVVLQTTDGALLVLDSGTGREVWRGTTARAPWPRRPAALDDRHVAIVTGPREVVLLDTASGRTAWTYRPASPSLTTDAPSCLTAGRALLVLVDGWQLVRLDTATGRPCWERAVASAPLDASRMCVGASAVFYSQGHVLHARALGDGRTLWQRPLGPGAWRLLAAGDVLSALPVRAEPVYTQPWTTAGYLVSFPVESAWRDVPVRLVRPADGAPVQRFHLPATGPEVAAQVVRGWVVVASGGRLHGVAVGSSR